MNGLLMLPLDTLNNEALNYPIGTNDLKAITNKSFAKDLFMKTPQFYFMGKLDENDAVPYSDAFDQDEREQIYRLLGEKMQPERWNNCIRIYENLNVNATILSYDGVGHDLIVEFQHRGVTPLFQSFNCNGSTHNKPLGNRPTSNSRADPYKDLPMLNS